MDGNWNQGTEWISGTIYKEGVSKQIYSKKLSSKGRDVRIWKLPERQKENQEWM